MSGLLKSDLKTPTSVCQLFVTLERILSRCNQKMHKEAESKGRIFVGYSCYKILDEKQHFILEGKLKHE